MAKVVHSSLTSSSTEQLVQAEGEERVWHLSQESLEKRRKLHRVLFR